MALVGSHSQGGRSVNLRHGGESFRERGQGQWTDRDGSREYGNGEASVSAAAASVSEMNAASSVTAAGDSANHTWFRQAWWADDFAHREGRGSWGESEKTGEQERADWRLCKWRFFWFQ